MQRRFEDLADRRFDLLVIGGGVTGAMIAWEATLRGLSVALVERADFCGATSAANSRLIHGGLRYLRQGQLGVVRESLRERRYWLRAAPHQVTPLPFLLPARSTTSKHIMHAGLRLYDWLGGSDNMPETRVLSTAEATRLAPLCADQATAGALLYYDAQMIFPERLVLAVLSAVAGRGAVLANYAEVERVCSREGRVTGAAVRDRISGKDGFVAARQVVNATGPWADLLPVEGLERSRNLVRSAGIHLVTRSLTGDVALAIQHPAGHFFIIPWRGHSLVGTTDQRFEGHPDAFRLTGADIDSLLETVNAALPDAALERTDVLHAYGGLRSLLDQDRTTYRASRRSDVIDHGRQGLNGFFSALGGKWTTARSLAARVVDRLTDRPSASLGEPLPGAGIAPENASPLAAQFALLYGAQSAQVLAMGDSEPLLPAPEPLVPAQARYAAAHEMAISLTDVVFRRTAIGLLGRPNRECLEGLAQAMAGVLGWNAEAIGKEIEDVENHYRTNGADR